MMDNTAGKKIDINGVACAYETCGEGRDVLLLHGWGGNRNSMRPLFNALKDRCRVTAIDFAGHGESGRPDKPEGWSVTEYAQWLDAFLEQVGIRQCDIVAHSFGGRVAAYFSAHHPEKVRRMILTGAPCVLKQPSLLGKIKKGIIRCGVAVLGALPGGKKIRSRLQFAFGSADYRALDEEMRRTFVRVVTQDLRPYLSKIQAPTLLIWGTQDTAAPLWMAKEMEREIPDAALIPMEGNSHFAYLERAGEFSKIMCTFLLQDSGKP